MTAQELISSLQICFRLFLTQLKETGVYHIDLMHQFSDIQKSEFSLADELQIQFSSYGIVRLYTQVIEFIVTALGCPAGVPGDQNPRIMEPDVHGTDFHDFLVKGCDPGVRIQFAIIHHDGIKMLSGQRKTVRIAFHIVNAFLHVVCVDITEQVLLLWKIIRKSAELGICGMADLLHTCLFIPVSIKQFFRTVQDILFCFDTGLIQWSQL